jgi:hypothetical protein
MRFMMMMKADKNSEAGLPPDPKLMAGMAKFMEEMTRSGAVLVAGGLGPSSKGTRFVATTGDKLTQMDGPFAETKELIAGFAIIQAKSKEEAIEQGRRFMKVHREALGPTWEGTCEIRPLFGPEDGPGPGKK